MLIELLIAQSSREGRVAAERALQQPIETEIQRIAASNL